MSTQARPSATGLTARYFGDAGGTTARYYWIQGVYDTGAGPLAGPVSVTTPAALSNRNLVQVGWKPAPGAIGYKVYTSLASTTPSLQATLEYRAGAEIVFADIGIAVGTENVGYSANYIAKAIYNFAVDGGGIGAITPQDSDTIPANAVIIRGQIYVQTAVTSAGSATVSIGTTAGSSAASILAATAKASLTVATLLDPIPLSSAATAIKMSAAGQINFTVGTAALTAGVIEVMLEYYLVNL